MNITFRPATSADVDHLVPLIFLSAPESFDYVFKVSDQKDAQYFLRAAFLRPGGEFSYTNHICVLKEDTIVGTGAAYTGSDIKAFTSSAIKSIFRHFSFLKALGVVKRGLATEKIVRPPKGNTEYLAHLAISPEWRSKGIGTKMIQYFLAEAQKKGRVTASLDVSAENPRAKELYEELGFEVKKERISTLKNKYSHVPSHYKMFITLQNRE